MPMSHSSHEVQLSFAADTDVGRMRQGKPNQDSFGTFDHYCSDEAVLAVKGKLFVVADGMGGAAGGKEASTIAVEVVFRSYYADPDADVMASLQRAIEEANTRVHQHGREHPELRGLGTTIVLALIHGSSLIMGNVGDSRGYFLRQGHLQQLSLDHTSVQDQVRAGLLTPEEALTHPRRHVLSRNLGYRPKAEPEFDVRPLATGDVILLCSDGLSGCIDDAELAVMLREAHGEDAVEAMINLANERGGPDNITAMVITIDDAGQSAASVITDYPGASRETDPAPVSTARQSAPAPGSTTAALAQPAAPLETSRRASRPARQPLLWAGAALATILLIGTLVLRNMSFLSGAPAGTTSSASQPVITDTQTLLPAPSSQVAASASALAAGVAVGASQPLATAVLPLTTTATITEALRPSATALVVTAQPVQTTAATTPPKQLVLRQVGVSSMALARDGGRLAAGSSNGTISVWRLPEAEQIAEFQAAQSAINDLAFSPDGKWLALSSADEQVKLFSIDALGATAEQTLTILDESGLLAPPVYGLELTQNGALRYVTEQGGWMVVSEEGGIGALPLGQPADGVRSVVFAANGAAVAILREDKTIQVVRVGDPTMTHNLPQHDNPVAGLAFSEDGQTLLVIETSGTVECWLVNGVGAESAADQPRTCKETNTLAMQEPTEPAVQATALPTPPGVQSTATLVPESKTINVAFSEDGQQLVSVDQAGIITRWELVVSDDGSEISEAPFRN